MSQPVTPIDAATIDVATIARWQSELAEASPKEILRFAFDTFPSIAISFSGAEDVALIELAQRLRKPLPVFSLDTGRLHPETYQFIDKVRSHYALDLDVLYPEASAVEALVKAKGLFSFYQDGHQECCGVRKVAPLRKKLSTLDAWITGQRRDQSPGTRAQVPVVQLDEGFSLPGKPLVKFNPLANWTSKQVWDYLRAAEAPYNALHERGFVSIGCEPCTRAVLPGQHEREGRWWWEEATHKECGLHSGNVIHKN